MSKRRAAINVRVANLREIVHDPAQPLREISRAQAKIVLEEGAKEENADQLAIAKKSMATIQASLAFMLHTLETLKAEAAPPECPLCLEPSKWGQAVITHCGHIYCHPCASQLAEEHHKCATCREPLAPGQWSILTQDLMTSKDKGVREGDVGGDAEQRGSEWRAPEEEWLKKHCLFGSKLAHVMHRLLEVSPFVCSVVSSFHGRTFTSVVSFFHARSFSSVASSFWSVGSSPDY
jgi:hypothetical protein